MRDESQGREQEMLARPCVPATGGGQPNRVGLADIRKEFSCPAVTERAAFILMRVQVRAVIS
jgi:hypothetical protein